MRFDSKIVKAARKVFQCTNIPKLSKGVYQKSSESSLNQGSYGQMKIVYFEKTFSQFF